MNTDGVGDRHISDYHPVPIPEHPSPLDVLGMVRNIRDDYQRGATIDGTPIPAARGWDAYIDRAIPVWWTWPMLSLALASPLPPDYVLPRSAFSVTIHLFRLPSQPFDSFCDILDVDYGGGKHGGYMLVPLDQLHSYFPHLPSPPEHGAFTREDKLARDVLAHLTIFMQSAYVALEQNRNLPRQQRRAAERKGIDPTLVRFVTLRSPMGEGSNDESERRDWQYRWLVRGHYRNQWYASENTHRTIWIGSYVKGPEDKPLRTPVYKVVR